MAEKQIPYEFHITVEATSNNVELFRQATGELGVKSIILDLGVNNGRDLSDYQTSSTSLLDGDQEAFEEMDRIGDELADRGFNVVRRKIEAAPWHPNAPQYDGEQMPDGSYFEAHLAIGSRPEDIATLRQGIIDGGNVVPLHLSRNVFKQPDENGEVTMMATLRDYRSPYERFAREVQAAGELVTALGFGLKKPPITEFAVYDSNTNHDNPWMQR